MYNWAISYDYHIFKWCLECTTQWYPVQPIRCCCLLTCCGHVADLGIMYMTAYVYLIRIHTNISQMYMCMLHMYTHIYIYKYMKSNHIYLSFYIIYIIIYIYIQTCIPMDPIMISQETPQVGILFGHFATTGDGLHVRHLSATFPRGNDGNAMEKRPIYLGQL